MDRVPFPIAWTVTDADPVVDGGKLDARLQRLHLLEARASEAAKAVDQCQLECLLLAVRAQREDVVNRLMNREMEVELD